MNPYSVVEEFEEAIAEWTGAQYAVAVESCSMALLLCCLYRGVRNQKIAIPNRTYPGTANAILHAGGHVRFYGEEWKWEEMYELEPVHIFDAALCLRQNMFVHPDSLYCLSFHAKKHLPIGRGGMILCKERGIANWFRLARFDGRNEVPLSEQEDITVLGYNAYMTPEQAIRGLQLFSVFKERPYQPLLAQDQGYPDLSKFTLYK